MGARVVDRQPAGLGERHDRERDERRAGSPGRPPRAGRARCAATIAARFVEPTRTDSANTDEQDGRLDQRGDGHLAAGAHATERGAGVEPGQREEHRAQQQQRDDREQVRDLVQRRARW